MLVYCLTTTLRRKLGIVGCRGEADVLLCCCYVGWADIATELLVLIEVNCNRCHRY